MGLQGMGPRQVCDRAEVWIVSSATALGLVVLILVPFVWCHLAAVVSSLDLLPMQLQQAWRYDPHPTLPRQTAQQAAGAGRRGREECFDCLMLV